ncbi:PucR family transcriptional regulator [Clostridiaceae bacterium 35-E11]
MWITISEALKLDTFRSFQLVAGKNGLNNKFKKVGILDWEIGQKIEGQFGREELILSSFLGARNNVDLLFESIKNLIEDEVSGLGIKNIYFKEIPAQIIDYADKKKFPIFIFDNSVFVEDIITEVRDVIRNKENYQLLQSKMDAILAEDMSNRFVKETALELNPVFKENFIAVFCQEKQHEDDTNIIHLLEDVKKCKTIDPYTFISKYRDGIFIIYSFDRVNKNKIIKNIDRLMSEIGIDREKFYIGISNDHHLNELNIGMKESLYAVEVCEIEKKDQTFFKNIGVYKILMPFMDKTWIHRFCNEIIVPLQKYDEQYHTEILNTVICYVENDGNVKKTSEALIQHENTIRYRINKVKELLHMGDLNGSFYEQLFIAIKIYKALQDLRR